MTTSVALGAFNNYGISTTRSGFVTMTGVGGFTSSGGLITNAGLIDTMRQDLIKEWTMYDGLPVSGNEFVDVVDGVTVVKKQFFTEVGTPTYTGVANYGQTTNPTRNQAQHVMILESTDAMSPNGTSGPIDQKYRIRFEFDERPRLYLNDKEFAERLYQLNLKIGEIGGVKYETGNTVDDSDLATAYPTHTGYSLVGQALATGWESLHGIPNTMYSWFKVSAATKNQISTNGDVTAQNTDNALITLENGSTLTTAVSRYPGECVDMHFEDITLEPTPLTQTFTGDGTLTSFTVTTYNTVANTDEITIDGTTKTEGTDFTITGQVITFTTAPTTGAVIVITKTGTANRRVRFRNKRKGNGWFKRFPHHASDTSNTYPISYRITMTERGFFISLYGEAGVDREDNYAWVCIQRTVNNETGLPRTDTSSRFPTHAVYSCTREALYARDFGVYFTEVAYNLQTAANQIQKVYDSSGNELELGELTSSAYILSPFDREDFLADEYLEKKIWRFVVREYDTLKPWDVHKLATKHQNDSNAIINPQSQLAITDDNRFVITFPTGLTTQRHMYPKEELDLICFSSAEVVAESSNIPMQTFKYDGTNQDNRRYQGLRGTLSSGNGMRVMILVNGQHIYNSDVNID